MALSNDSILVTPGSGATVATHLASGKEHQVVMLADDDGNIKGTKASYVATYRLASEVAQASLTFSFVANTEKQWATLHHAASATKTATVRRVELYISATAATILNVELRYLTGATLPATGNPAVTPRATVASQPAAEAVALALPTTAGTHAANQPFFSQELNLGANTALTTTWPPDPIVLWPAEGTDAADSQDIQLRAGVAEGVAVSLRSTAAVAVRGTVRILFTEH